MEWKIINGTRTKIEEYPTEPLEPCKEHHFKYIPEQNLREYM